MGIYGFGLWIWYYFVNIPRKLYREYSEKAGKFFLIGTFYVFSTYFLDNTLTLFDNQFIYYLIPLALCYKEQESKDVETLKCKEKLLVHIHWDGMANKKKDSCFSHLIAVSDYIGQCWRNGSGCDEKKIIVLPNCAKVERFDIDMSETEKGELREKLGIPSNHKVVIFTGRIVKEKGVKELLTAFEQLKTESVTLVIVGSANFGAATNTEYEREVENLISKSKRNIVFTGFIHQTDLYKYYGIADVAVMPSLFQDPAPLVSIETQATGTPLIATRVGGIPEYVGTRDCGILIEKDEYLIDNLKKEIDYLLANESVCNNMKTQEKKHAQNYTTKAYYKNFTKIINQIARLSDGK